MLIINCPLVTHTLATNPAISHEMRIRSNKTYIQDHVAQGITKEPEVDRLSIPLLLNNIV
jgi:hypothetical protein